MSRQNPPVEVKCSMPGCDNLVAKGELLQWCLEHIEPKIRLSQPRPLREEDIWGEDLWASVGKERFEGEKTDPANTVEKDYEGK